jgi:hypothetical protein
VERNLTSKKVERKEFKTFADITPEDIQDMKARHGAEELSLVSIKPQPLMVKDGDGKETAAPGDGKEAKFIIKTPGRTVLDVVGQYGLAKNVVASNKALISNCVLGGDMDVMEKDGGVYSALLAEINKLVKKKEVTVKKL